MSIDFSRKIYRSALAVSLTTIVVAVLPDGQAVASQGPGTTAGGASAVTQLAMAIIVYGAVGILLAAGLIGVVRRR